MDKTCQFDRLWAKVGPTTHSARQFARKMPNNIPIESFLFDFTCVKRLYLGSSDQAFDRTNKTGQKHVSTTMEQTNWLLVSQVSMNEACFLPPWPMTDPWCCYIWCAMDPINKNPLYVTIYTSTMEHMGDVSSTFGPNSIRGQLLRGLWDRWLAGQWLVWTGGDPWIPTPWVSIFSFLNLGGSEVAISVGFYQIPKISQVPSAVLLGENCENICWMWEKRWFLSG